MGNSVKSHHYVVKPSAEDRDYVRTAHGAAVEQVTAPGGSLGDGRRICDILATTPGAMHRTVGTKVVLRYCAALQQSLAACPLVGRFLQRLRAAARRPS